MASPGVGRHRWPACVGLATLCAAILASGLDAQPAAAAPKVDYGIDCVRDSKYTSDRRAMFLVVGEDIIQIANGDGPMPHALKTHLNVVPGGLLFRFQLLLDTSHSWAIDTKTWDAAEHTILVGAPMDGGDLTFNCRKVPGSALN